MIDRYEQFAADSSAPDRCFSSRDLNPSEMHDDYFEGDPGYWWCRHHSPESPSGKGVFCIANVTVPESIRGQGVFGEFLDHIMNNPHRFGGVEVEAIFNDRLIEYLEGRGFVRFRENAWDSPTLRYMFGRR